MRLRTEDIRDIRRTLRTYDKQLLKITGGTLQDIACRAVGINSKQVRPSQDQRLVAVIPVTWGRGIIKGFAQAVEGIASHLGFPSFVTKETDVLGLGEAFERKASVILLSDDRSFLAICPRRGRVIENSDATGRGFATALTMMKKGLRGEAVLVVGTGHVGRSAAVALVEMGAHVSVYDVDQTSSRKLSNRIKKILKREVTIEEDLDDSLRRHRIYFDASPSPGFIHSKHITTDTFIAAPGIPLGISPEGQNKIKDRLLHDPLQIGVATMLMDALYGSKEKILP